MISRGDVVSPADAILALTPRSYAHGSTAEDVSALESKSEVQPKEWLLAKKRELMREFGPLAAMHRANGQGTPADAARKRHRALVAKEILDALKAAGQKEPSEAALERMANAHEKHVAFCTQLEADAIRYQILAAEKEEIEYRLRARETELNAWTAEVRAGV